MVPDVNVRVAVSRSDHPHHELARSWPDDALAACAAGANLKLSAMVVARFLQLVTDPRIVVTPAPVQEAVGLVDALLSIPGVGMPAGGTEWPLLRHRCLKKQIKSNSIPDAWLAATIMRLVEHLVTFDGDFKKLLRRERFTVLAV